MQKASAIVLVLLAIVAGAVSIYLNNIKFLFIMLSSFIVIHCCVKFIKFKNTVTQPLLFIRIVKIDFNKLK